jgi:hypothetical protein
MRLTVLSATSTLALTTIIILVYVKLLKHKIKKFVLRNEQIEKYFREK